MPVTSFNIPPDLLALVNEIVASGAARNRTEIIVRALENFVRFEMHRWRGNQMVVHGMRTGMMSESDLSGLIGGMSDRELYQAGKRIGAALKDSMLAEYEFDPSRSENHRMMLGFLEDSGWGRFVMDKGRIIVEAPFLPPEVLHGILETALSLNLKLVRGEHEANGFTAVLAQVGTRHLRK